MNFDSVTCQDHKITKKKPRLNRIKTTLKSQKSVLKKIAYEYATMPQRVKYYYIYNKKKSIKLNISLLFLNRYKRININ